MSVLYFVLCLSVTHDLTRVVFVEKFKFILMKMHKNCCHHNCFFWLRYAPNHPKPHWGRLQCCLGGGVPWGKGRREGRGKRREGREGNGGEESRNAQIQSWQAYVHFSVSHLFVIILSSHLNCMQGCTSPVCFLLEWNGMHLGGRRVGYTIVWSGIHECNECISPETIV